MRISRCILTGILAGAAILGGCRGDRSDKPPRQFLPDMDDQPRWTPQSQSPMFGASESDRTSRPRVAGTVAFGRAALDPVAFENEPWYQTGFGRQRANMLRDDAAVDHGVSPGVDYRYAWMTIDDPSLFVADIPIPVTRELLERGRSRFDIFCATCHGFAGEGGGFTIENRAGIEVERPYGSVVGQRWSNAIPSLHDPKYLKGAEGERAGHDGYLYYTAMYGVGFASPDDLGKGLNMPGYKHALSQDDAWGIVAYIRALQLSRNFRFEDLREEVDSEREIRETLIRTSSGRASTDAPGRAQFAEGAAP